MNGCGGRTMAPKGLHALRPGSHDVTLHGRRELAGVAKGPEVGSSSWTAWAGPFHRDPGGNGVTDEAELGAARCQGGGRGCQPRDVGAAGRWRGKEAGSPWSRRKEHP